MLWINKYHSSSIKETCFIERYQYVIYIHLSANNDRFICNLQRLKSNGYHYNDAIMSAIASQITGLTIVYSIIYSDEDLRKHQSSASLAFVPGIHRWSVKSPHKRPVTRKCFHLMMSSWFNGIAVIFHNLWISSCIAPVWTVSWYGVSVSKYFRNHMNEK